MKVFKVVHRTLNILILGLPIVLTGCSHQYTVYLKDTSFPKVPDQDMGNARCFDDGLKLEAGQLKALLLHRQWKVKWFQSESWREEVLVIGLNKELVAGAKVELPSSDISIYYAYLLPPSGAICTRVGKGYVLPKRVDNSFVDAYLALTIELEDSRDINIKHAPRNFEGMYHFVTNK